MTSQSRLLQLPLELIQLIAELAGPDALLALRLTSKYGEAAVFDLFASEFLSELSCYVVDPARLRRTKHLTSTTRLARRIKNLRLHIDPYNEVCDQSFSLAPIEICTLEEEAGVAFHQCVKETHDVHRNLSLDQTLVTTILEDLSRVPSCQVLLDIQHPQTPEQALSFDSSVTQDLLNATIASDYPLRHLELDDGSPVNPKLLTCNQSHNLSRLAAGLHTFVISYDMETEIINDEREAVQHALNKRRAILLILENASSLKRIDLCGYGTRYEHMYAIRSPANTQFTSALLTTGRSSALQFLGLTLLSCRESELMTFIGQCRWTLSYLIVSDTELVEWDGHWVAIFKTLLGFPKLCTMRLCELTRVENEQTQCAVLKPGTEHKGRHEKWIDVEGVEQVQEALSSLVRTGVAYIPDPWVS